MFDLFFTNRISSIAISEHTFREQMLINPADVDAYVKAQLNKSLYRPLYARIMKMEIIDFKSKEIYENITSSLVRLIVPEFIKKDGLKSFNFERYILIHFDNSKQIIQNLYEGNSEGYAIHLKHLFEQHNSSYLFLSELARRLIIRYGDKHFISERKLYDAQFECLVEGLQRNGKIIPPEVVRMFWGIISYDIEVIKGQERISARDDKWRIHKEAIEIFKHNTNEKDLRHFLQSLITTNIYNEGDYGLSEKLIEDVFGDFDQLKTFVQMSKFTSDDLKSEFLDFVEKYNENKPYVKYNFKFLNLS